MVTVKYFAWILLIYVGGTVGRPQDPTSAPATAATVEAPEAVVTQAPIPITQAPIPVTFPYAYEYPTYDYGKQYGDYDKQYDDYDKQYDDYVKQYIDYVTTYGDYVTTDHYVTTEYSDYAHYDYGWDDDYSEYFVFGDRNNPLDTVVHMFDDTGLSSSNGSQMPWVYIIVPVVQIDVFYVDPDHETITDVEMQLPIETFFFELGDFGMGHLDLGDFGISDFGFGDYHHSDYELDYSGNYDDYPLYGHYQGNKADLYASGEDLDDLATLDYPGIDHEPYWFDWIFMIPPDDPLPAAVPIVR